MCYNIGGSLIAVLTNILWHGSHRLMACLACCASSFPLLDLYSYCSLSVSSMLPAFPVISLLTQRLSVEADLSPPLFRNITEYVRGFWMGIQNWDNALQFTTWGKFCPSKSNIYNIYIFFQGDTLYLSLSFSTHITQYGIPILVLKMSHRTGQAGIGYAVQANNLQTSVSLAAVPFSAGLWIPRSHPGGSWLVMALSKIPLSCYTEESSGNTWCTWRPMSVLLWCPWSGRWIVTL